MASINPLNVEKKQPPHDKAASQVLHGISLTFGYFLEKVSYLKGPESGVYKFGSFKNAVQVYSRVRTIPTYRKPV